MNKDISFFIDTVIVTLAHGRLASNPASQLSRRFTPITALAGKSYPPSGSVPPAPIQSYTPLMQINYSDNSTIPAVFPQIAHKMEQEFVLCDLDAFMKEYLPFVPDDAYVRECVSGKLRSCKLVSGTFTSTLRFTKYSPPLTTSVSEIETYADLKEISDVIGEYVYPGRSRNIFHYQNTPHSAIDSDIDGSTHNVDACFTSDPAPLAHSPTKLRLNTTSMAVPMVHKLTVQQVYDNNKQIVSANVQIMNDDVRRMFTFGITIECDQVTLWFHSRSHSAISTSFSFVEEPKLLIKVFMSILFASEVELGYDPNVTKGEDSRYTFKIPQEDGPDRFFRTIKPIAEYRSNNITGRMTRIFKVTEVNTSRPKKKYVLKDVWIEADAQTEGQIQKTLFENIEEFWRKTTPDDKKDLEYLKAKHAKLVDKKKYKDFFLAIETDWEGQISKEVPSDAISHRDVFNAPTLTSDFRKSVSLALRKSRGTPRPVLNVQQPAPPREYAKKKQYRVVFKEICTSVGELKTLGKVTDILHQVLTPLQLMFCAGWVHRDISSGNILAHKHKNKWKVKLSDLEYAKKFPPPRDYIPATDPKTATPYFMPHEILANRHIYISAVDGDEHKDPFSTDRIQVVIHNFQHDLESVWWLLLWTLVARIKHDISNDWAKMIFQNTLHLSIARDRCFCESIHPKLHDILATPAKGFSKPMDDLRQIMVKAYHNREKDGNIRNAGTYLHVHSQFEGLFAVIERQKGWRKARKTKLIVDRPHRKKTGVRKAATQDPPEGVPSEPSVPVKNSTLRTRAIQPQPTSRKPRVHQPARVKRELSDDERAPPLRPGPSKRSKR
ncbi:hypothetical protein CVT25_005393 [Psilocybe cyanescens]|uniref:Fungal-type protein kinase domain-containing protein n=1 Tax=Psilocybe cyanescens TaxID=93625 RepID=A0A409WX90_PSICY|nr:hypothetical protein CVT25_005393 [Psilocybe cyanescens]